MIKKKAPTTPHFAGVGCQGPLAPFWGLCAIAPPLAAGPLGASPLRERARWGRGLSGPRGLGGALCGYSPLAEHATLP